MKSYTEFCNNLSEQLFNIIDTHGGLLKWKKEWSVIGSSELPMSSNGFYRGANLFALWLEQYRRGWRSNHWLTFLQVKKMGGQVLKGAKGTQISFWKINEVVDGELKGEEQNKTKLVYKIYTVFNLDQTSLAGMAIEAQNRLPKGLDDLLAKVGAQVSEFGNQPHYNPREDVIVMPQRQYFKLAQDYDVTLCHELIHFTGVAGRLNRLCAKEYGVSEVARAEEELVAELGSVFLSSYFGIAGDLVNHASYVASWKKLLDAKAVARAMTQASRAFDWLVSQVQEGEGREAA